MIHPDDVALIVELPSPTVPILHFWELKRFIHQLENLLALRLGDDTLKYQSLNDFRGFVFRMDGRENLMQQLTTIDEALWRFCLVYASDEIGRSVGLAEFDLWFLADHSYWTG